MASNPSELVAEFCRAWATPRPAEIAAYFTEDAVYHNIPLPPVHGRAAIEEFLTGFCAAFEGIEFIVHRQICDGPVVMNERTDVLRRRDGKEVRLPVMGTFEIADGRIAAWRDYFDLSAVTEALG
ncbi:limonene-1,2-epoxide hydrolase family protein [Amycolatopsis sp. 195334CR]|uniref:limonene-1,2-epoxide hydrolase family protein n=1 Tax=Amycolatopsis sp. 195334CR TaxID=2814588 RepID=UPI001A8EE64A|nr:limonene-1,2-epoxide hydrolase family protein [Amycolatopsis sp. 195334CR]MBN6040264.1 nuclear transport factor 2 family protein [Amycolatopsis sp. 195334CR]